MIRIDEYEILSRNCTTLKETSIDNHDGKESFMTESMIPVINFDDVKDEYVGSLHLGEPPKSIDAIYCDGQNELVFIEFKNGAVDSGNVKGKVYDSLLILSDIVGIGIGYTRENMDFIVVYNNERNPDCDNPSRSVQTSQSRGEIGKFLARLANEEYIRFDLERFKGYCFRNVYTYTQSEFENNFVQQH